MDLGALFNPQGAGGPGQDTWASMFADPRLQGALLSIGGALAQPPQFGQTGFGHLLGSLGAGGESVRTQEALDTKQQEADSKAGLRESQAQLAESRARTAGAGSETQAAKLEFQREKLTSQEQRNLTNARLKHSLGYAAYVAKQQKDNQTSSMMGRPIQPLLTPTEYNAKFPELAAALGLKTGDVQNGPEGDTGAPDSTSPVADPNEGRTATGPGGKKMIYRGGQWQPL